MRGVVVFDLDDTLFRTQGGGQVYENNAALLAASSPYPGAAVAVRSAMTQRPVCFLTGRGERVRVATRIQLRALGVYWPDLHMQASWGGWDAYYQFKVDKLRSLGAVAYVADTERDQAIAEEAGVRFLWPEDLGIQCEVLA